MAVELARGLDLATFVNQVRRNLVRTNLPGLPYPRYPDPRTLKLKPGGGALGPTPGVGPDDEPDDARLACIGQGGTTVTFAQTVAGLTNVVLASTVISQPFIIRHINSAIENMAGDGGIRIRIADDNDTTGGLNTTGTDIIRHRPNGDYCVATGRPYSTYPNTLVLSTHKFIKVIFRNGNAGATVFVITLDYDLL